jgi:hypothetical protein
MKKIFTLLTGLLLAVVVMAADHRPMVSVNSMKNYKIVIDGKSFFIRDNNTIRIVNMYNGRHSIQVYEMNRGGFFGGRERMVASTSFNLRNKDVRILVDRYGRINIREIKRNARFERNERDWNDRDFEDRDWNDRNWNDRNDRDSRDRDDRDHRDRNDHDRRF